jgi:hypothetical protein
MFKHQQVGGSQRYLQTNVESCLWPMLSDVHGVAKGWDSYEGEVV